MVSEGMHAVRGSTRGAPRVVCTTVIPRLPNKLGICALRRHLGAVACALVLASTVACDRASKPANAPAAEASRAAKSGALDSAARQSADSAVAMAAVRDTASARRLSPAADSIAPYLVFVPTEERTLVAAVRNKVWLLDVGRMDFDVRKDNAKTRAFREAARVLSPVPPRTAFRLHWANGAEDVVADSFAVYNGRIVMRVIGSLALDSAARGKGTFVAFATRADSATPAAVTNCDLRIEPDSAAKAALAALTPAERKAQAAARKLVDSTYDALVMHVRDSLEAILRIDRPPYERLQRKTKAISSQVRGCFGPARRALIVSVRAGDAEWVRERLVLIAPDGTVTALRIDDLRLHAHELLTAFDADGDGVDDLAVKGSTTRAGGTAILRVDLAKKRAERMAAGFSWEVF